MQRILEVKAVHLALIKTMPPKVVVLAHGIVSSSGWTNPSLDARFYVVPPADGIQDYDFNAERPTEFASAVETPISAEHLISRDLTDYWGQGRPLVGVRIHAQHNHIEALMGDGADLKDMVALGGDSVVPWPLRPSELIGKRLRVYRAGDILTDDHVEDRVNIELSSETGRIVGVWVG